MHIPFDSSWSPWNHDQNKQQQKTFEVKRWNEQWNKKQQRNYAWHLYVTMRKWKQIYYKAQNLIEAWSKQQQEKRLRSCRRTIKNSQSQKMWAQNKIKPTKHNAFGIGLLFVVLLFFEVGDFLIEMRSVSTRFGVFQLDANVFVTRRGLFQLDSKCFN